MAYQLPDLPYAVDALEPYVDAKTMEIHHGKHHAAYVANLNAALDGVLELQGLPLHELLRHLDSVPAPSKAAIRNNGGGHYNHALFWESMKPNGGGDPVGALAEAICTTFGSASGLRDALSKAAITRFGSGWAWLSLDGDGRLVVHSTANQDIPLAEGRQPLLGLDVWEHAYYLRYQNRRSDYVQAWWNTIDWERINERYLAAGQS